MPPRPSNPTHIIKCLPRMSWTPANLYNLWQRTFGPPSAETRFNRSSKTMFQQRWKAKQLVRAYHGDWIQEKKFIKEYFPNELPPLVSGEGEPDIPVTSLMLAEIEKRLDVVVFRCCYAESIYAARQMVLTGKVKLNGAKHRDPNTKLEPGDLLSVDPRYVVSLRQSAPKETSLQETEAEQAESESESPSESAAEETKDSEESTSTTAAEGKQAESAHSKARGPLPFKLPDYASPFLFIPPYIEPSFSTCSAIYLRHPTATPGVSEVASPYDANGDVLKLTQEYYASRGRRTRKRPQHLLKKRLGA